MNIKSTSLFKKSCYAISALVLSSCVVSTAFAWTPITPLNIWVHIQDHGDRLYHQSEWAGTMGESRRLEVVNIMNPGGSVNLYGGHIAYRCHLEGTGDTGWVRAGDNCGMPGQSRRMERLEVAVFGNDQPVPIRLACHVQNIGFMVQAANNYVACGTTGRSLRLEAIDLTIGTY